VAKVFSPLSPARRAKGEGGGRPNSRKSLISTIISDISYLFFGQHEQDEQNLFESA
jgi:hypothetical protein